jgi:hypothetical protein
MSFPSYSCFPLSISSRYFAPFFASHPPLLAPLSFCLTRSFYS